MREREAKRLWLGSAMTLLLTACATGRFVEPFEQGEAEPPHSLPVLGGTLPANCSGLECQRAKCPAGGSTSLSGVVHDPSGTAPLYNVIVYVPNGPLEPLAHGPTCDRCGAAPSGNPVVTALTDTRGAFRLEGIPAGRGIPLVMQIGKWRRRIEIPEVRPCEANRLDDPELMRLPRNRYEGEMPRIALATGCDPMECALRRIGIDDSEFTADWGSGAVHVYRGREGSEVRASSPAEDLWSDEARLMQYDVVINACECNPHPRSPRAMNAMRSYLDAGGRVYASHYHYNWFTDSTGPLATVADWTPGGTCNVGPNLIDTTFPKGHALAQWMSGLDATSRFGELPMTCAPQDVAAARQALSQRWVYDGPTGAPSYLSFNTPVDAPEPDQCGRAVFADLHVSDPIRSPDLPGAPFPYGCSDGTELLPQERVFEFLLFDVGACIQKDADLPIAPPIR